ncbi:MAG: hypothetical protein KC503_30665 [Myxococcales bacterium]|nr:hypothetical protein [Myxococcales bacterium]
MGRMVWVLLALLPLASCLRVGFVAPDDDAGDAASDQPRLDFDAPVALDAAFESGGDDLLAPTVVLNMAVQSDLDDGELDGSGSFGTNGYAPQGERNCWTYMGGYSPNVGPGDGTTISFFRFALPRAIPDGATIVSAKLELYARAGWMWQPQAHTLSIFGERASDAARVTSLADSPQKPGGRTLTTASQPWGVEGDGPLVWPSSGWQTAPDLSAVVQEIVDGAKGVAQNAHLQLFIYRPPPNDSGEVAVEDYCHSDGNHARLSIAFRR